LALIPCVGLSVVEAATRDDVSSGNSAREERADRKAIKTNCLTCGRVRSITAVTEEGESTGVGAALGAIVGGIAGHQVGGGTGNKIATVAGAVGGAVAGNAIEKNRDEDVMYDVRIEMENGDERIIRVPDTTGISEGSDVTVEGNQIYSR
ncbi:MAG: glycine zipper 2TM domain-containing protein, partial [Pseudomonadota bacterium]